MGARWAGLLTMAIGLSACAVDDTYLPALQDDPMASYEADGLVLADSWNYKHGSGFLGLRGRGEAEVGRTYTIEDQGQAERLLVEAVAFAESEGWAMSRPLEGRPHFYRGDKELDQGPGRLVVALGAVEPVQDPNGPQQMNIRIVFDPAPADG